jgi:Tfp pilus assembly protein PilP
MDSPLALVEDPEGIGHVMEMGSYVGRNWGRVTQISDNEVVVTEEYRTINGELVVNPIKMQLVTDDL